MIAGRRAPSPVLLGLVGAFVGAVLFGGWYLRMPDHRAPIPKKLPYARTYVRPDRPIEWLVNIGDGQAFAALATDPALDHPLELFADRPGAAYRAQRPLIGYLAWATSLGQRQVTPYAVALWSILGVGLLVGATAWAAQRLGRVGWPALLLAIAPGSYIDVRWLGPEALGTALVVLGLGWWVGKEPRRWAATACFVLAGLARETMLVVPVALGAWELWKLSTGDGDRASARTRLSPLAAAPAAYLAWLAVVRLRYGAWSFDANEGRLSLPLLGLVRALGDLDARGLGALVLVAAVAGVVLVRRRPPPELTAVVGGLVLLGACMGQLVWARWEDFSRPLLPVLAVGLLAVLPAAKDPAVGGRDVKRERVGAGL